MTKILILQPSGQDNANILALLNGFKKPFDIATPETILKNRLLTNYVTIICLASDLAEMEKLTSLVSLPHLPILCLPTSKMDLTSVLHSSKSKFIDFLAHPILSQHLHDKLSFLIEVGIHLQKLTHAQQEIIQLQKTVRDLHRSVDGHNSFLDMMSKRDGLTGLYNRHHFKNQIQKAFRDCSAGVGDLSLVVFNIDYFSEINKSCGQDFGDFVLNELSARITDNNDEKDLCFRLSGEDFAALLPSCPLDKALDKAENIRHLCQSKRFDNGHFSRTITTSMGVASYRAHLPRSCDEFINMADQALFLAKSEGRNRVKVHAPIDKSSFGTSDKNLNLLKETINKILNKTKISTLRSLQLLAQGMMDTKETVQVQHAQLYAQLLSQELGLTPSFVETFKNSVVLLSSIRYLLHNEMINKKGNLSKNEWLVLTDFPYKLDQITTLFDYFSNERSILLHHGEKYDGTGYPEGLKGDEIPVGARIFSLISAVAAMNTDRPYRKKLSPEVILSELATNAGKQFDPQLVLKLIDVIEEKGILEVHKETLAKTREKIRLKFTQ